MAETRTPRQRQADLALSRIRRARPWEAAALSEIAMAAKAHWGYSASFMARCRMALAIDPAMMVNRTFRLAEDAAGGILGFYGFEAETEGIGLSHFFVLPAAIGQGVGRALWADAVARATQLRQRRLIIVSDPNAAGFYARMGARPAGARPSEIDPSRALPVFCLDLVPDRLKPARLET
jgi:GNAT superfamily N-acetyltransferase